jgi:hypothetical protein
MQDLYATELGISAELEHRRRHLATLRRASPLDPLPRKGFRVSLAEILAHLALHLDGHAIGEVAAQHTPPAGHGHGRPA